MRRKLFVVSMLAATALLGIAGTTLATTATVSPTTFSGTSASLLFLSGSTSITCHVTLNGTLASRVAEVERSGRHLGAVTSARINGCNNGATVTVLNLSWEITTETVEGTLPNEVTGLNFHIENVSFNLSLFGGITNCLYQGNARAIMPFTSEGSGHYEAEGFASDETVSLPKHSGSFCPNEGVLVVLVTLGIVLAWLLL